jgi:hypothetical protein
MADKVRAVTRAKLHALPHVTATWTGRDGKLRVGVERKVSKHRLAAEELVPAETDGRQTDVVVLKNVRTRVVPSDAEEGALVDRRELTQKRRPCPGGFSVGHYNITAGTLGCWVKDREGEWVILSNNHVLADSNAGVEGDRITQPGPVDLDGLTTDPTNWIGQLQEFATINQEGNGGLPGGCSIPGIGKFFSTSKPRGAVEQPYPNLIDAAVARRFGTAVDENIHKIGIPAGFRPPEVGEPIKKSGRTTEHTTDDEIEAIDMSVQVSYGSFTALFEEQLLIISEVGAPFSQPGDSGSAIVGNDNGVIGLLFAGGQLDDGRDATIACNIVHVQTYLGVSL